MSISWSLRGRLAGVSRARRARQSEKGTRPSGSHYKQNSSSTAGCRQETRGDPRRSDSGSGSGGGESQSGDTTAKVSNLRIRLRVRPPHGSHNKLLPSSYGSSRRGARARSHGIFHG